MVPVAIEFFVSFVVHFTSFVCRTFVVYSVKIFVGQRTVRGDKSAGRGAAGTRCIWSVGRSDARDIIGDGGTIAGEHFVQTMATGTLASFFYILVTILDLVMGAGATGVDRAVWDLGGVDTTGVATDGELGVGLIQWGKGARFE